MIPDDAVEAAAMALHFFKTGKGWKDADPATVWECREQAESIIRQAAPRLMAAAWERGAVDGWKQSGEGWNAEYPDESTGMCSADLTGNPYRQVTDK